MRYETASVSSSPASGAKSARPRPLGVGLLVARRVRMLCDEAEAVSRRADPAHVRIGPGDTMARRMARFWARVHSLGLLPTCWVTLEVPGHRSGELRRFPLGMADVDGEWFLVSMLGECAWVRNVRAAGGRVVLRRRRARACTLQEVPVEDRGPILRRYVDKVPGGRPHIPVDRGAPVAEFQAVAADYPVFVVIEDADAAPR